MIKEKNRDMKFIVIIPIIVLFLAVIFDFVLIFVQEKRLKLITESVVKQTLTVSTTNYRERVKQLYEKKNITADDSLEVDYADGILTIYNSYSYDSFFGKILGINTYRAEINIKAHLEGDKVIIEEVNTDAKF